MLDYGLLDSAAWRACKPAARAVYVQLLRRYNGSNNGSISFSVREARDECGMNINTAMAAFHMLEELGFIDCLDGSAFNRKDRHAREWRLTAFRCDKTGELSTRRFKDWRPASVLKEVTDATPAKSRTQTQNDVVTDSIEVTAPPISPASVLNEVTVEAILGASTDSNEDTHIHLAIGPALSPPAPRPRDEQDIAWLL